MIDSAIGTLSISPDRASHDAGDQRQQEQNAHRTEKQLAGQTSEHVPVQREHKIHHALLRRILAQKLPCAHVPAQIRTARAPLIMPTSDSSLSPSRSVGW
jgi:hypothetical protein